MELYLQHHGIFGQKWGKRHGPPYPLGGGKYFKEYRKKLKRKERKDNSLYNKKHYDKTITKGTVLSTLSYDKDRTKDVDMFYAAYKPLDKHQYNALFNKKVQQDVYDENGNRIGHDTFYKFRINNVANKDIKVASEDSGADTFKELWSKDRDFYNFVIDPSRMQSHFVDSKYRFKGYREARSALEKMRNDNYVPTEKEVHTIYRMFNYVIPSDGGGNARMAKDVATQRAKLFKALNNKGYGAMLDTNDAIYGGFKATAPVIVFDMSSIVLQDANRVTTKSKRFSNAAFLGRKVLGI